MSDVSINGIDGATTVVQESALETLQTSLRGELLRAGQPAYEDARKIHNGMIDRHPALIVRCAGVADVMRAVDFARNNALLVSVRAGGHGVAGLAVCDGGLMIDLSRMKGIHVDPTRQTARADAGVTWGEFDHETQAFGLATTGGVARPTGIAGLTLAGGHGFLMRKHGLACDNLLSVDVVTADGQLRTASATENPDLFWGVRGGGGNFGVVTSFEYQLHPVGLMLGGLLIYPMEQARQVLKFYHEFTSTAPDELGSLAVLGTLPDGAQAVVILLGYNGPVDQGEQVLRPLRTFGTPIADQISLLPYSALQSIVENFNPPGLRNYWKMNYLRDLPDEAIDVMVERYATNSTPFTHLVLYTLGGAVSRVGQNETAVAYRDARHAFITIGMWSDSAEDEQTIQWVRDLWSAMQPFAADGFYINYEADVAPDRVEAAYGPEKYVRLVALKNQYDPENLFRLNQNIRPTV
jgi:FAD/FMN-containing dehydrogenase